MPVLRMVYLPSLTTPGRNSFFTQQKNSCNTSHAFSLRINRRVILIHQEKIPEVEGLRTRHSQSQRDIYLEILLTSSKLTAKDCSAPTGGISSNLCTVRLPIRRAYCREISCRWFIRYALHSDGKDETTNVKGGR